jgi:hypothetical protein
MSPIRGDVKKNSFPSLHTDAHAEQNSACVDENGLKSQVTIYLTRADEESVFKVVDLEPHFRVSKAQKRTSNL